MHSLDNTSTDLSRPPDRPVRRQTVHQVCFGPRFVNQRGRSWSTYNLLRAAAAEGEQSVVYLSSLRLLAGYAGGYVVDEKWHPMPTADSQSLTDYLGEFTCCEFARQGSLRVMVLRLGPVRRIENWVDEDMEPPWLDPRDVAQVMSRAVRRSLAARDGRDEYWSIYHIRSKSPSDRFSIERAKKELGFQPQWCGRQS